MPGAYAAFFLYLEQDVWFNFLDRREVSACLVVILYVNNRSLLQSSCLIFKYIYLGEKDEPRHISYSKINILFHSEKKYYILLLP